jgi:hypothetical protein
MTIATPPDPRNRIWGLTYYEFLISHKQPSSTSTYCVGPISILRRYLPLLATGLKASLTCQDRQQQCAFMTYLDRVKPVVDQTISTLASARFVDDPIAGEKYSRMTSIISSAYKRHGTILELALHESLRESNRHKVWRPESFLVSRAADQIVGQQKDEAYLSTQLPYGESCRTLQIDMMVFDSADQTLRAYEIKRGNGQFDAGKIRSIKRDLVVTQMLLKSYGQTANVAPEKAEARIIFYCGRRSIPRPYSLIGSELNEHFGFPVYDLVEEANAYFKQQLYGLLDRIRR